MNTTAPKAGSAVVVSLGRSYGRPTRTTVYPQETQSTGASTVTVVLATVKVGDGFDDFIVGVPEEVSSPATTPITSSSASARKARCVLGTDGTVLWTR